MATDIKIMIGTAGSSSEVYVKNATSFLEYFTVTTSDLRNTLLNKGYITCDTSTYSDYDLPIGYTLNTGITVKKHANGPNFDVYVGNISGLLECFTDADGNI